MTSKLLNGTYFGKLLTEMHPTYIKRTNQAWKLDGNLTELKDSEIKENR